MGLFKRVFRPIRKVAKKIIPKEIRPFLPYIAAALPGAQGLASLNAFMNPAAQKALLAGVTSAATDEQGNPLRAAALAAAPDVLSGGLGKIASKFPMSEADETLSFVQKVGEGARRGQDFIERQSALKTIGAQTAVDQSAKFAEIRQDEIDEYNEQLRKQGVLDKSKRRSAILNIYRNAGYDDDYVNNMLDRYGYDEGGLAKLREQFKTLMSKMKAPETVAKQMKGNLRRKPKDNEAMDEAMLPLPKPKDSEDEEEPVKVRDVSRDDLASGLMAAASGVERAFGRPFGNMEPAEFKRFAKGGEVEIEEETDDLSIMDFMKDQGIPYGEQASYGYNEAMSDTFDMFLDMKKNGLIPPTMEFDEFLQEVVPEMGSRRKEGIMQMASGYKDDIEEMYEQYVFEMEEMGLEPMSFSEFLAREKAGMKDGGKVKRRKKGEPMDDDGKKPGPQKFPRFEDKRLFEEKMPQVLPNKPDMMEAAMGGIASMADGGIMEKDMRGGGFIPEGSKERADDVPARLSKNEFVMTADAVRAAGGGSVNKGAKRMYDLMYNLEGRI